MKRNDASSTNFGNVLESKDDSDITIIVDDKELFAHKNILSAKSNVFKSMFTTKMSENLNGVINIEDFAPEVIEELLQYIYTGRCKNLNKVSR